MKFEERRKKIERQEKEWLNMKRWLKEIEENGEKRKIRRKERKERECMDEEKGYMIMK